MRTARIYMATTFTMMVTASGCSTPPEPSQQQRRQQLTLATGPATVGVAALAVQPSPVAGPPGSPPRLAGASLRLLGANSAALGLALDRAERKRMIEENKEATFTFALNGEEEPVVFNDLGRKPDLQAGDGQFTAAIPIDLERLSSLDAEVAQSKTRTVVKFAPGTREAIGREEVPRLDLERLRAGQTIALPALAQLGPLRTLGGSAGAPVNPQKSLLITALPVIEDPGRTMNPCAPASANSPLKTWTFGHLMTEMAQGSGLSASDFVERWLGHWRTSQTVTATGGAPILDGVRDTALASVDNLIINPWRQRSGGGALDLRIAPFHLEAIVYRPDLATSNPYNGGGGNNGGELRFVFGLVEARDGDGDGDARGPADTCQAHEMAVIFEYGVPLSRCQDIKDWANKWVSLSALLQGTAAYGTALEALTEAVVLHGAAPAKPNQNALDQLRTNEIDLTGIWQFREFVLRPGSGPLIQTTTKNNPREHQAPFTSVPFVTPTPINLNGTATFLNEVLANLPQIVGGTYVVPELSAGQPYLGGSSSYNNPTFWDHPALASAAELTARFKVSLNTCSGCHTGETATSFYQIRPNGPGSPPTVSDFLRFSPFGVTDNRGIPHTFSEMDHRKQELSDLANQICSFRFGVPPLQIFRLPLINVH
jgi:hypothetical protein